MEGLTAVYEENRTMSRFSIYLDFMHIRELISLALQDRLPQLDCCAQRVKRVDFQPLSASI